MPGRLAATIYENPIEIFGAEGRANVGLRLPVLCFTDAGTRTYYKATPSGLRFKGRM